MSWPCAHTSIWRAAAKEATLISGPNQGMRRSRSDAAKMPTIARQVSVQVSSSSGGGKWPYWSRIRLLSS